MIVWLASYPKSGNTWVRLFLNSLLNDKTNEVDINNIQIRQFPLRYDFSNLNIDMDNIQEFISNCIVCQDKINLDNSIKIFKTHNAFWKAGNNQFTNEENTKGVIHIVRDPRNIITSVKNHFSRKNYDEALKFMTDEKKSLGSRTKKKDTDLPTVVSSWSNHYKSWKKMKKNYLLIKYENLLNNPKDEFNKIINYLDKNLNLTFNNNKIENAIKNSDFKKLKYQENEKGFKEAAKDENGNIKKFFFLGPKNDWKILLDEGTIKKIEDTFKNEMTELGYL